MPRYSRHGWWVDLRDALLPYRGVKKKEKKEKKLKKSK
jgi:hypothetical protein